MKINVKKQINYLFYVLIIFFIVYLIKKTLIDSKEKQEYKHNNYSKYDTPVSIIAIESENTVESPYLFKNNMTANTSYDSYEPRFIAPRYYDTQFLTHTQPVYTRTHGYYHKKNYKNKNKKKRKYKAYNHDSSSSDSSDD